MRLPVRSSEADSCMSGVCLAGSIVGKWKRGSVVETSIFIHVACALYKDAAIPWAPDNIPLSGCQHHVLIAPRHFAKTPLHSHSQINAIIFLPCVTSHYHFCSQHNTFLPFYTHKHHMEHLSATPTPPLKNAESSVWGFIQ